MKSIIYVTFICVLSAGCATVHPWERGTLAKTEMQINPDNLRNALKNHIYFSKEAATGGFGISGGGCGCN